MAFELRFSATAVKQLRKLDRAMAARIADYLEAVAAQDDPTIRGKNLKSEYSGIWRYRIGNYCALCDIDKSVLVVLALEVSHRLEGYKK